MDPAKREITAVLTDLPLVQYAEEVNKRLAQLEGMAKSQNQTYYELDQLRSGLGLDRFYKTRQAIGNSDDDYDDWTVHQVEDDYNIWKHTVDDYAYDPHNSLRRDEIVFDFMGEAVTDGDDPFDAVFTLSGGTYTDRTAEAGTDEGTPFNLGANTPEELLVGHGSMFSGIDFRFFKPGSGYALEHHYSQSTGWGSGAILREDGTNNWRRSGLIRYNPPGDWAESDINGQTKRWIRIKTTTVPTQRAMAYAVQPATNVKNMLSLNSEQLLKQGVRKWCSFGNTIYVTARSKGDLRYNGNLFIQLDASAATKRAFFKVNHKYEADYKNSDYISAPMVARLNVVSKSANYTATTSDFAILVDASGGAITITLPTAVGNTGRMYNIKKTDSSTNAVIIDGNGAETIDGDVTKTITDQYVSLTIISDGNNWSII